MADDDKPSATVFRLVDLNKAEKTAAVLNGVADVTSNAYQPEDEYQKLYIGQANDERSIIEPPYNLRTLHRLAQENNSLSPCVEAMVTNCDGTGYAFHNLTEATEDDAEDVKIKELEDFFAEPWPGQSFITQRKLLRRDFEQDGNAYLEVIRNAKDEIVFLRPIDSKMMRMVKLTPPVPVDKTVTRKGKEVTIKVATRERAFTQLVNGITLVYYKEFGSSRDLNKTTGAWSKPAERLPFVDRASEIIHFSCLPDAHTPYGIPRWINQLPSILGSRRAEEFNLEFFENGGVPPVMILLQGGILGAETRRVFEQAASTRAAKKNRTQIIEVEPTGGTINSPSSAKVTVERFGAERQSDSMFETYDFNCETRVRRAFRLPPIFVGQAQDYSFATAVASYSVAEAQVFQPMREEFDEIISIRLLPAMGYPGYKMRSKPLTIEDVTSKLKGIELAIGLNHVEPGDLLKSLNETCGTNLKLSEKPIAQPGQVIGPDGMPMTPLPTGMVDPSKPNPNPDLAAPTGDNIKDPNAPKGNVVSISVAKKKVALNKADVGSLALEMMSALRNRDHTGMLRTIELAKELDEPSEQEFRNALAVMSFIDPTIDQAGLAELAGCTIAVMAANQE